MHFQLQALASWKPLITFILPRFMVGIFIGFGYVSGIVAPTFSYPEAPRVTSTAVLSNQTTKEQQFDTAQVPNTSQVMVVAIGEKKVVATPTPTTVEKPNAWGVAKQIDEYTWTMNVQKDDKIASAEEIFAALNTYRQKKGKATLTWDGTLASYAQSRADTFVTLGNTDKHAGFTDYINNQDGFAKLGFNAIGENSSFGYQLTGTHLIEWVYAGDAPHDDNQLSDSWSHVGIGVSGLGTDLVFAGSKR